MITWSLGTVWLSGKPTRGWGTGSCFHDCPIHKRKCLLKGPRDHSLSFPEKRTPSKCLGGSSVVLKFLRTCQQGHPVGVHTLLRSKGSPASISVIPGILGRRILPPGGTSAGWASESGFLTLFCLDLVWEIPDKQLRLAELKPWSEIQQNTGPTPWGLQTT